MQLHHYDGADESPFLFGRERNTGMMIIESGKFSFETNVKMIENQKKGSVSVNGQEKKFPFGCTQEKK